MSESLLTKPVIYIQSASNGVVTCVEQRMRPEDFPNVFHGTPAIADGSIPADGEQIANGDKGERFPTFPAIEATLTRALLPISLAYGVIPSGKKLPYFAIPSEQWEAGEKYWLHTVQTSGYVLGNTPFDKDTAFFTNRVLTYKNEPPPGDMPYYDPANYTILDPVDYPVDLTRGMRESGGGGATGEWPQIVTAIPKQYTASDPQFVNASTQFKWLNGISQGSIEQAMVENAFLFLYSGIEFDPLSLHVIKDGSGGISSIDYFRETFEPGNNPGCSIYGFNPLSPYYQYISTQSGSLGNTDTERAMVAITAPTAPIMSHVITPTEEGGLLPSLVCLGGLLGLIFLTIGAGASDGAAAAAAARKRLRRPQA